MSYCPVQEYRAINPCYEFFPHTNQGLEHVLQKKDEETDQNLAAKCAATPMLATLLLPSGKMNTYLVLRFTHRGAVLYIIGLALGWLGH
jgi:hypothetical protein